MCPSSMLPPTLLGLGTRIPNSSTPGDVGLLREAREDGLDGGAPVVGLSPVLRGLIYEIIVVDEPSPLFWETEGL